MENYKSENLDFMLDLLRSSEELTGIIFLIIHFLHHSTIIVFVEHKPECLHYV